MTKKKKRPGRQPVPIDNAQVELLASRGLSIDQIANSIGIAPSTLSLRKTADVALSEAINRGRAAGIKMVSNALYETAMAGNVAAQIFFLKNRAPEEWRDKIDIEVEQKVPRPLVIEVPCIDVTPKPELKTLKSQTIFSNESYDNHAKP